MSNFFDFNNDGHVDLGEQYVGYKIFEDCTKDSGGTFGSSRPAAPKHQLGGFEIFMIVMLAYVVLSFICSLRY